MEDVTNVCVTEYIPTIYTRKCTLNYTLNNKEKSCDLFAERPGVVIIIYNKTRNVLVLVKQFRASSYFQQIPDEEVFDGEVDTNKYKPEIGVTLEFCAGLEDKNISTEEIAIEEIYEECGYDVKKDNLERITEICNLSTTTGARSTFYYCEVIIIQSINPKIFYAFILFFFFLGNR